VPANEQIGTSTGGSPRCIRDGSLCAKIIGMRQRWTDPEPGTWIVERIHDFGVDVGSVIPEGFDAYARLFHPASRTTLDGEQPVRWSEVASTNSRVVHPEMQWPNISGCEPYSGGSVPGVWDKEPNDQLPRDYAGQLADLLAQHTTTSEKVWFCVWTGYGGLNVDGPDEYEARPGRGGGEGVRVRSRRRILPWPEPTLRLPQRDYYLFVGPVESITESFDDWFWTPANLRWPDDRAWCVATEIDFTWTYLGGTRECVNTVLAGLRHSAPRSNTRSHPPATQSTRALRRAPITGYAGDDDLACPFRAPRTPASSGGHCNTWASLSDGVDQSGVCCWRFPTRNSRNTLQARLADETTPTLAEVLQ
jgi:hypothetical protein